MILIFSRILSLCSAQAYDVLSDESTRRKYDEKIKPDFYR